LCRAANTQGLGGGTEYRGSWRPPMEFGWRYRQDIMATDAPDATEQSFYPTPAIHGALSPVHRGQLSARSRKPAKKARTSSSHRDFLRAAAASDRTSHARQGHRRLFARQMKIRHNFTLKRRRTLEYLGPYHRRFRHDCRLGFPEQEVVRNGSISCTQLQGTPPKP